MLANKNISNNKKSTLTLKILKEKMIQKYNFINIIKINALTYYHLIKNKENKLFSLTINKIYNTLIQFFEILSQMKRDNRILINKSNLCDFAIKYKKCYKSYTLKFA